MIKEEMYRIEIQIRKNIKLKKIMYNVFLVPVIRLLENKKTVQSIIKTSVPIRIEVISGLIWKE